jgi:hypothetical protein
MFAVISKIFADYRITVAEIARQHSMNERAPAVAALRHAANRP